MSAPSTISGRKGQIGRASCRERVEFRRLLFRSPAFTLRLVPLAGLAKVEAAEQFAYEKNVGAFDDFGTQGAIDCKFFECEGGAQVGETTERRADLQQAGLGALIWSERVEFVASAA